MQTHSSIRSRLLRYSTDIFTAPHSTITLVNWLHHGNVSYIHSHAHIVQQPTPPQKTYERINHMLSYLDTYPDSLSWPYDCMTTSNCKSINTVKSSLMPYSTSVKDWPCFWKFCRVALKAEHSVRKCMPLTISDTLTTLTCLETSHARHSL